MGSFLTGATGTGNSFAAQQVPLFNQDFGTQIIKNRAQFDQTFNAQNALANQLQGQALGAGPNPAQQMLKQATDRNIQQTAGGLASAKGISPALAARLSAQFGAQQSQQAAGQGALMGAQQQLQAQQGLAGLYGQQQAGAENMYSTNQNAAAAHNNAAIGQASNINNVNAGVAAQNTATAGGLVGGALNAAGAASGLFQSKAHGGMISNNVPMMADGGMMDAVQKFMSPTFHQAEQQQKNPKTITTTIPVDQSGHQIPRYANGGMDSWGYNMQPNIDSGPSLASQFLNKGADALRSGIGGLGKKPKPEAPTYTGVASPWEIGGGMAGSPVDNMSNADPMSQGAGMAQDMGPLMAAAKGGMAPDYRNGGKVGGQAQVQGDSFKNDTQPAMLSPGEIVIPRHITMHADAPEMAAHFVKQELAKHKMNCGGMFAEGGTQPDYMKMADLNSVVGTAGFPQDPSAEPTPDQPVQQEDQGPANMPKSPSPQMNPGVSGMGGGSDAYLKGQQDLADKQGQMTRDLNYQSGQKMFNLDAERDKALQEYQSGQIDPNKYWNNASTGQKIGTTIGLLLSGLGSGLTGRPNMALDILNKHIDNDIDAQKANLGKQYNLLQANHQAHGDLASATEMTRMMQKDAMAAEIQKQAVASNNPVARLQAQQLVQGLQLQNAQTMGQLKMLKEMQQGGAGSSSPALAIGRMSALGVMPKEDKEEAYKELSKSSELQDVKKDLKDSVDHIHKQFMNGLLSPADTESAKMSLAGRVVKLTEGRFNQEAAKNIVDAFFPRTFESNQTTNNKSVRGQKMFDSMIQTPVLDRYGIRPQQQTPMNKLRIQKGWK